MDFYTEDLIDEINNNGECNFIACAVTFLHAVGINATIRKFFEDGIRLKGYILILAHPTTGRVLKASDFKIDNTEIIVINYTDKYKKCHCDPFKSRLLALKESLINNRTNRIYILWTELDYRWFEIMTHVKWAHQLCYIKIDDGGGSYVDGIKNSFRAEIYEGINSGIGKCKTFFKIFCRYSFNKILQKQLMNHYNYIDNRIFIVSGNRRRIFTPNEKIIPYYRSEFKRMGSAISKEVASICSKSILINTQCLFENKMTNGCVDLEVYRKVVDIAGEAGLSVALKSHPRELNIKKYECLGVALVPSEISQEVVLANMEKKPKYIISIFSSTLLNAWVLFDIPAISLAKIMLRENINEEFKRQLDDFIKQYNGMFFFPDSYEELKSILVDDRFLERDKCYG